MKFYKKIICFLLDHEWEYGEKDIVSYMNPDIKTPQTYRECKRCEKYQIEVWHGFAEFTWI